MTRYLIRRAALGVLTLFLFATMSFFFAALIMPGDYTSSFLGLSEAQRQELRRQLGIDVPLWQQYLRWLGRAIRADLGMSFAGSRVTDEVWASLPYSLFVFVLSVGGAFVVGGWLGRVTAWRKGRWLRGTTTAVSIGFYTSFPPWLAFVTTFLLTSLMGPVALGHLQTVEEVDAGPDGALPSLVGPRLLWFMLGAIALAVVTVPLVGRAWTALTRRRPPLLVPGVWVAAVQVGAWVLAGVRFQAFDVTAAQSIPLVLLFLLFIGEFVVLTQAAMAGVDREDYVLAARGKGLPERDVRDRHAARAAILPILTRFTVSLPYFLAGMIIVERALESPGVGSLLFNALDVENTPTVMGALVVIGVITVGLRLVLDVLLAVLDPRIRFAEPAVQRS